MTPKQDWRPIVTIERLQARAADVCDSCGNDRCGSLFTVWAGKECFSLCRKCELYTLAIWLANYVRRHRRGKEPQALPKVEEATTQCN